MKVCVVEDGQPRWVDIEDTASNYMYLLVDNGPAWPYETRFQRKCYQKREMLCDFSWGARKILVYCDDSIFRWGMGPIQEWIAIELDKMFPR